MATATNKVLIRPQSVSEQFELWISDQHNLESRLEGQIDGISTVERNYLYPDLYLVYVDPRYEVAYVVDGVIAYLRNKLAGTQLAGKGTPDLVVEYPLEAEQGSASL